MLLTGLLRGEIKKPLTAADATDAIREIATNPSHTFFSLHILKKDWGNVASL